ncbi:FAD-dependent oxidoreductase [Halostagnicola sp. A-GB9-2]|uniref:NAD(P)/FAD-dependent oxidoreductase n=1 Tax=Halostagnicola sp. A-GB9-2 TaxID=3048066 RepID=UPI0024C05E94|nr:FAD-dependent oxidoreductase [Halostagnicola sp. A-GB9-2]MDJ1434387.1 FAD-dependent oxidoreductase [Halostagnicola sp. A-GB9-2]
MVYDVAIIGTGPAGLSAGAYAGRRGYEVLFFEDESIGGELVNRHEIRSYPGFPDGIAGTELRSRLVNTAESYEPDVEMDAVERIDPGRPHELHTEHGQFQAAAVVIATGSSPERLEVAGESDYWGRGVFDCATCDGPLYAGERIAVVGGRNHAVIDALFLTNHASEVLLVEAAEALTADESLAADARANDQLEVLTGTSVTEIRGEDGVVSSIRLRDHETDETRTEPVGGLNVNVGAVPNTSFLDETVELDDDGSVIVGPDMETSVEGIYAAGDVRRDSPLEVAAAVGDGVTAVRSARSHVETNSRS